MDLNYKPAFQDRHNGPDSQEVNEMLSTIGVANIEELIEKTIPEGIRLNRPLNITKAVDEQTYLKNIKEIGAKNKVFRSLIGQGYYGTHTPTVILRNILENPGWYTQYTPYQAEISQGRLEALINFQTLIMDLTGMEMANASLLDEATAAAESMGMFWSQSRGKNGNKLLVDTHVFPQTLALLQTRAEPMGIEIVQKDVLTADFSEGYFGAIVQYPNAQGEIHEYKSFVENAHAHNCKVAVAADIMALVLLTPPGEWGADVVFGSSQRFGIPMGYGGPHAAYFATKEEYKRLIPGRIIGVSVDAEGNPAYRMALQTREQHIKRDRATSNICTAQVLLAIMSGMYAVYHGPTGLKKIAEKIYGLTTVLRRGIEQLGFEVTNQFHFDTLTLKVSAEEINAIKSVTEKNEINLFYKENQVVVSLDEVSSLAEVEQLISLFASVKNKESQPVSMFTEGIQLNWTSGLIRTDNILSHVVFNSYHSEHEMLRYLKSLENKDLSLVHSMISLGSCTMKLNATSEMIPVTYPEFGNIHPFAPLNQAEGYKEMIEELEQDLAEITGFDSVSLQPNSGAQGEYTGLMVIREYFKDRGEAQRNIALIPESAHGTNPASAVMAGMKVVVVKCDERGRIDLEDLKLKAEKHKDTLACLMVTYPSTNGVFESHIQEVTQTIHDFGGQVYLDGANMNAQVGLTNPGIIGADVCHLNLHKTFCIPHGGGGPGMGPIGVAPHLTPYLPSHPLVKTGGDKGISAISAAPFGSSSILLISYGYIKMMGSAGLKRATEMAILNANYLRTRLKEEFPILYTGQQGMVAHEMIIDTRIFKPTAEIQVEDIAKRLMDYGFHAPTVSFPVPGTMMIEPTESESKEELDRFLDTMFAIREEIRAIEMGNADKQDNVLKNAPHTAEMVITNEWKHTYSREEAAYPVEWVKHKKFWPSVARVDNTYGDRNLVCACLPMEAYEEQHAKSNA